MTPKYCINIYIDFTDLEHRKHLHKKITNERIEIMVFSEYVEYFLDESNHQGRITLSDRLLEEAVISSIEEYAENHYLTEAKRDSLWVRFKKFLVATMESFKDFQKSFKRKLSDEVERKQLKETLLATKRKLEVDKRAGVKMVPYPDFMELKSLYAKTVHELESNVKRVLKMQYRSIANLNEDLDKCEKIIYDYQAKEKAILEEKKLVSVSFMLNLVENELRGNSDIFNTLSRYESMLHDLEDEMDKIEKRKEILGDDILPKKLGILRRLVNKIGGFIKSTVVKLITKIVFIFA